ncbi:MAG: glycosyltransferase [Clostridia bacterium]|nr:glycosyltransferase [Clostridia bacterium]
MKIGLFNDSFPPTIDGVANTVVNYARVLTDAGDRVTVVTPKYPHVEDDYDFEVYRYLSVKFAGEFPYRIGNPFSPVTVREVYKHKFDLMHVHSPFASAVLAHEVSRLNRKKVPTVLTYHTKYDVDIDRYLENRQFNTLFRKFTTTNINRFDEVWAVSRGTIPSLRAMGYEGEVRVMPNGTDFPRGKAPQRLIAEIDRIYRTEGEENVFLYCGRMMWYKNIQIILDSLKNLAAEGIPFRTFFVGDSPDRPSIEQYAKKIGLSDRVVFTGSITDREKVRAFFSRADLLLFPSTYDTSGLVVKEAAACGCPAALIAGACAAEDVTDGETGLLSPTEDAEGYTATLLAALRRPGFLKELGRAAEEKVYWSWEDSIHAARRRYEELLEEFRRKEQQA